MFGSGEIECLDLTLDFREDVVASFAQDVTSSLTTAFVTASSMCSAGEAYSEEDSQVRAHEVWKRRRALI